jgi:erythronate-4-phosphate dehydrogenase
LVENTPLRFVGTATIGTDHVDLGALKKRGIHFVSAPGSNANSVGEYVVAALLALASEQNRSWEGKTLGIVGVGNCGSRVEALAPALGLELKYCDPPLARTTGDSRFQPLEGLMGTDILTFHVPLTREGREPTFHMINEDLLSLRPPGSVLINASRGAVADTEALLRHFGSRPDQYLVLDVWEGEPRINLDLLQLTSLGSPHIAGYSFDGKVKGMLMLYKALCEFLGMEASWSEVPFVKREMEPLSLSESSSPTRQLDDLVRQCYDIRRDDQDLRRVFELPRREQGGYFDSLRKAYRIRREFGSFQVSEAGLKKDILKRLRQLGFQLVS